MSLRKALGWSSVNAGIKIVLGFFSAKVSAICLGPSGMVLVGQINSFMQVTAGAIGNGANTGVVNLTAEHAASQQQLRELWSSAMRLVLAVAGVLALLVVVAARPVSSWLLFDGGYWPVAMAAGLVIVLAVAENVVTGALNGLKQLNLIAGAGIVSTVIEFAAFVSLTYTFGVWGALFAMTGVYVTRLSISSFAAFRSGLITPSDLLARPTGAAVRDIGRFYPMLLAHSIALPLAAILVRSIVVRGVGLERGGYLQAAWRLSDVYVSVLTTALGLYFMAHFSALRTESERGELLRRTLVQVIAVTVLAAGSIYMLRGFVVSVVLTRKFLPMTELMPFQLAGDVFRMGVYPLQMALVSRRRVSTYIGQAVGVQALYVLLTFVWLPVMGLQAAPCAYASAYAVTFGGLLIALRSTLTAKPASITLPDSAQVAI
jgi:PST family polysaccharide transporter